MILNANRKQYSGADAAMALFGYIEDEFKSAAYSYERAHNYNNNLKGISSWSMGGITDMKLDIELYMTAVTRVEKLAKQANNGNADITLIKPFAITFTYTNEDLEEVIDIITCKFKSAGRTVNGEGGLAQQFEMFVVGMELNAK